jgi:hypothetical protein
MKPMLNGGPHRSGSSSARAVGQLIGATADHRQAVAHGEAVRRHRQQSSTPVNDRRPLPSSMYVSAAA